MLFEYQERKKRSLFSGYIDEKNGELNIWLEL